MNVLIVDDSIVFRTAISQALEGVSGVAVKAKLSNGKLAVEYLKSNPDVDLVTMDIEMPELDGLEATKEIRKFNGSVKILVFSGLSESGAVKTMNAIGAGANDFIPKQEGGKTIDQSVEMIKQELVPRIRSLVTKEKTENVAENLPFDNKESSEYRPSVQASSVEAVLNDILFKPDLICIGSSTGGPEALMNIFKGLNSDITIPIVIIQHMPPLFTKRMAKSLSSLCSLDVREAKNGDLLKPGVCYIAPGDFHLEINTDGVLKTHQGEKVCFVRPSVDVFLESVAKNYKGKVLDLILTGMGCDGANGSALLSRKGHKVLAQDEESSIVWGMPGAVHENGSADFVLPLEAFSQIINNLSARV